MTTADKIQYYRKKLGLSQEELGQMLLVSRQTVSLWENGQTAPTIDNLIRLKDIFGVSVDELLGCESEATDDNKEEQNAPEPIESYSMSFYKNELDKIYKYILKLTFKKPLISLIVLAALLAVYISTDVPDVLVGLIVGILVIFAVSVLKQFLSHRKVWKDSIVKVAESRYEYRVYGDYFTVDIIRNQELVRTEKINFSDIHKVHDLDAEKYVLLNINNQLYILRKTDLAKNSAFYMALYNSSKLPDKKAVRKLTVAANIFSVLSIAAVVILGVVQFEDFVLENPWICWLALPFPVVCTVLGFILKSKGYTYKKNVIIGIITTALLCMSCSFNYFLGDMDYVYDPVEYFTEATRIALPEEILDEYTVYFEDDTQPGTGGYIYSTSRIVFDEYYTEYFENSFKHDSRWLYSLPEELEEIVSPLDFDEGHKTADKMMLYNEQTGEFNTLPESDEYYGMFMAAFYHSDENMLELFEYEYIPQTEDSTKEEITLTELENALYDKIKSEILTWNEEDIYAISFCVYSNEAYSYRGFDNITEWSISYNTERDCNGAGPFDEERWNFAFWRQNMTYILDPTKMDPNSSDELIDMLFDWYEQEGITNIGEENDDDVCPVGCYEVFQMAANVAKKLHADGVIKEQFGKDIPIIVHELEYYPLIAEINQKANPDGQANTFLTAMEKLGWI